MNIRLFETTLHQLQDEGKSLFLAKDGLINQGIEDDRQLDFINQNKAGLIRYIRQVKTPYWILMLKNSGIQPVGFQSAISWSRVMLEIPGAFGGMPCHYEPGLFDITPEELKGEA